MNLPWWSAPLIGAGFIVLAGITAVLVAGLRHWRRGRKERLLEAIRADNDQWRDAMLSYILRPPDDPDSAASERLWRDFERPSLPYPGWYRPEEDRAAQLPGSVVRGAGAMRYFARTMHDHSAGAKLCPVCAGGGQS